LPHRRGVKRAATVNDVGQRVNFHTAGTIRSGEAFGGEYLAGGVGFVEGA
jgi:hypothetical protein